MSQKKNLPFSEKDVSFDSKIRTFSKNIDDEDLVWHRDREDRVVTVRQAGGWKIQFENQLPMILSEGDSVFIKKGEYHRVIKGNEDLIIEVEKISRSARSIRVEKIIKIIDSNKSY